jgi:predicted amidohydrolase
VNLATHERRVFEFRSELSIFPLELNKQIIKLGVKLCRDLKYPEQWRWLAFNKVHVFLHLINAVRNNSAQLIWKSQLISKATENQRYVLSINNTSSKQESPTISINLKGKILAQISSPKAHFLRLKIDLDLVSDWYLKQSRSDLITFRYTK